MIEFLESRLLLAVSVTVDGAVRYQTMDGFGTSLRVFDDPHVFENFDPVTRRAATVLTPSMEHAQRASRELPVGTVKVNAVFSGAPGGAATPGRGTGQGFGYGPELLDEMSRCKVVHWEPGPS